MCTFTNSCVCAGLLTPDSICVGTDERVYVVREQGSVQRNQCFGWSLRYEVAAMVDLDCLDREWEELRDPDGKVFYVNTGTQVKCAVT